MAFSSISVDSFVSVGRLIIELEIKIKTNKMAANTQVLRSKKSVVFCTPPSCCELPPNEDERPPPLGFCTMTTKMSKKQMTTVSPKKMVNVLILTLVLCVLNFSNSVSKETTFFWIFQCQYFVCFFCLF